MGVAEVAGVGGAGRVWQRGVQQAAVRAAGRGTVRVVALLQKDEGMKKVLLLVPQIDPSVPQLVVQSRRRPY